MLQVILPVMFNLGQYLQDLCLHLLPIVLDLTMSGSVGGAGNLAWTKESFRFLFHLFPKMIRLEYKASVLWVRPRLGQFLVTMSLGGVPLGLKVGE